MHINSIDWLVAAFSFAYFHCDIEHKLGTMRALCRLVTLQVAILSLFTLLCWLTNTVQISTGLWPLYFADMVYDCMLDPDYSRK